MLLRASTCSACTAFAGCSVRPDPPTVARRRAPVLSRVAPPAARFAGGRGAGRLGCAHGLAAAKRSASSPPAGHAGGGWPAAPLAAPAGEPAEAGAVVRELGLWQRPAGGPAGRPRVLLNMISSADGRATLAGRSGAAQRRRRPRAVPRAAPARRRRAGGRGHGARASATGGMIRDRGGPRAAPRARPEPRSRSRASSRAASRWAPGSRCSRTPRRAWSCSRHPRASCRTPARDVEYVRAARDGEPRPAARRSRSCAARFGVELLLCEGGPHLGAAAARGGPARRALPVAVAPTLGGRRRRGRPGAADHRRRAS